MAKTTTSRTGGWTYDASGFKGLAKKLREADRKAYRTYRLRMIEVGEVVKKAAAKEIEPYSKTIPGTLKVRVAGSLIAVTAGNADVPIGRLFEDGNHGGSKSAAALRGGRFRHPVFQTAENPDTWVNQPMHPYLFRGMLLSRPVWRRMLEGVLKESFEDSGIRVV